MKSNLFKKATVISMFVGVMITQITEAQTIIRPESLKPVIINETSAYVQNFDSIKDGEFPPGWGAWNIGSIQQGNVASNNPRIKESPDKESIRRIFMLGTAATTTASVYTFNRRLGFKNGRSSDLAIYASLNTSAIPSSKRIKVTFDALVMRNLYGAAGGNLVNALALQYRIGSTGDFKNLGEAIKNGEVQRDAGGIPATQKTASFTLPEECSGKTDVQLRWITKYISGTIPENTDDIPSFAIDNFIVEVVSN